MVKLMEAATRFVIIMGSALVKQALLHQVITAMISMNAVHLHVVTSVRTPLVHLTASALQVFT